MPRTYDRAFAPRADIQYAACRWLVSSGQQKSRTRGLLGSRPIRKTGRESGRKPLMKRRFQESLLSGVAVAGVTALSAIFAASAAQAWEPTKTVEFIVPAGEGGGADQMARMIQGIVQKHGLMDQSMVVINKSAGAGAEGFMEVVQDKGNEHKVIIT